MTRLILIALASLAGLAGFIFLLMVFSAQLPWSAIGCLGGGFICGILISITRHRR